MKVGDIVMHAESYWLVTMYDPKRTRTANLLGQLGTVVTLPHDFMVEVVANPSQNWPFVAAPLKPRYGPVQQLSRPPKSEPLVLYRDWLPSEPSRAGGSIFLSPKLGLRHGDFLLARHQNGLTSGIQIPANFATVRQNKARVAVKPKPVVTAYTRLLADKQIGDEDD